MSNMTLDEITTELNAVEKELAKLQGQIADAQLKASTQQYYYEQAIADEDVPAATLHRKLSITAQQDADALRQRRDAAVTRHRELCDMLQATTDSEKQ